MTDYTYGPGEWTALAHGGRAALLDPSIHPQSVAKIWESLSQGGSLESWLEVLAGNGLAALPSFGFVEPGDDGVRVLVRGSVTGIVEGTEVSAGGMRTWREHVAPAEAGVVLQVAPSDVSYPLIGGHVLASTLQVGELLEPVEEVDDTAAVASEVAPIIDEVSAEAAVDGESTVAAAAAGEAGPEPDFVLDGEDLPEDGEEPVGGTEFVDEAAGESPVEPSGHVVGEDAGEESGTAVLEDLPDGMTAAGAAPVWPPAAQQPWAVPAPAEPQANQWGPPLQQEAAPSYEQQPQAQPWHQPANDQPNEPRQPNEPWQQQAQPEPDLGDHDGYTMRAADIPNPEDDVQVDHTLAPAHEEPGEESAPQGLVLQLSLSTGQQVELDRPVLIGRAPESSRFGFGETPRLVTVPSPQQDISRTHVEIKPEGDSVLVTDLRSTNGTVVVLPGSPPRRLHPGESVPVPPGTVVDLGDGVTAVVGLPEVAAPIAY
jgi:hypothetical protein